MARTDDSIQELSQIVLFADLTHPELHEVDRILDEEFFDEGRRVLRDGIHGSNFYVIVDGVAAVHVDDEERGRLSTGDYFGEISLLLGQAPPVDVIAVTSLKCRVLPAAKFESFLLDHPRVMLRMLQAQALRYQASSGWHD